MPLSQAELERLELSDEQRAAFSGLLDENADLRAKTREAEVDQRVEELEGAWPEGEARRAQALPAGCACRRWWTGCGSPVGQGPEGERHGARNPRSLHRCDQGQ